jgi:hypothetical protein
VYRVNQGLALSVDSVSLAQLALTAISLRVLNATRALLGIMQMEQGQSTVIYALLDPTVHLVHLSALCVM